MAQHEMPQRIKFDYEKSNLFRVIYVAGVTGGPLPSGMLHMAVFNERRPIYKSEVYQVKPDGTVGDRIESESVHRDAVAFREIEASLIFDINAAKAMRQWLDVVINSLEPTAR